MSILMRKNVKRKSKRKTLRKTKRKTNQKIRRNKRGGGGVWENPSDWRELYKKEKEKKEKEKRIYNLGSANQNSMPDRRPERKKQTRKKKEGVKKQPEANKSQKVKKESSSLSDMERRRLAAEARHKERIKKAREKKTKGKKDFGAAKVKKKPRSEARVNNKRVAQEKKTKEEKDIGAELQKGNDKIEETWERMMGKEKKCVPEVKKPAVEKQPSHNVIREASAAAAKDFENLRKMMKKGSSNLKLETIKEESDDGVSESDDESLPISQPSTPESECSGSRLAQESTDPLSVPLQLSPERTLPAGWTVQFSRRDGAPYFFNEISGETRWEWPEVKGSPCKSRLGMEVSLEKMKPAPKKKEEAVPHLSIKNSRFLREIVGEYGPVKAAEIINKLQKNTIIRPFFRYMYHCSRQR